MKSKSTPFHILATTTLVMALSAVSVQAASDTWSGSFDSTWANSSNWLGSSIPATGETATFNGAGNGNTTIDLGAGVTLGTLLFDTSSAAAYTIGSGAVGSQTLTLGSTLGNVITMNSTVAANQLFNSNLALSVSSTANNQATYYALTNDSLTNTLNIAGGISASTAGVKTLRVTGSGNTNISGAITSGSGNVSLFKTGSGTLTLSGGATFSGSGITDGSGFTTSAVFREGLTILDGGTYSNSNNEFVIGGVATHGGPGTNATLQVNNGTTLNNINWLSIGRGNGNGTATSNLTLNGNASVSASNLSAGYNANNAGNIPKGTITLNGTSMLSIANNVNLAESAGSNFTMNINDTATFRQTTNNNTRLGISDGAVGVINVTGGTASFERDLVLGAGGTGSGKVVLNSGTVNVGSGAERWLILNENNSASGQIDVNGGNFNLNTNTDIRFSRNATTTGTNVINLNGGAITGYTGNNNGVFSSTSVVDLNQGSTQAGVSNTFNLNGGTLTIGQVITGSNSGNAAFNFNGGTLRAAAASTAFLDLGGANQRANVRNGGAIIDTNGNNVTVTQALLHSNIGGDNATDGGLTKNGSGTLTLSGANTYTGLTTITGGTVKLDATGTIDNSSGVSLGTVGTFDVSAKSGYTVNNLIGSGTVTGALTVSTQLAIGNSPGTVNFSSDLTLGAASTYLYELTGGSNTADLGDVAGGLTITTGAILDLVQLGTYTLNDKFTLFAYDGALAGNFSGLADDSVFNDAGGDWLINYNDTTAGLNGGVGASFVTVTAVPEPAAALLGGLGMLALLRRRRN